MVGIVSISYYYFGYMVFMVYMVGSKFIDLGCHRNQRDNLYTFSHRKSIEKISQGSSDTY